MYKPTLLLPLLLLAVTVQAQELTLFEPIEQQPGDDKAAQGGPIINQNGQPAYTLRSSVRIGDSVSLTLVDRQGKQTKVSWKAGQRAPLPGAAGGYAVEDIQQRAVVLSQPGNDPCLASPKQGVSCLGNSRARLTMALAAPLAPSVPVGTLPGQQNAGRNGVVGPQNPFEAALQAQQQQAQAQGVPLPVPNQPGVFVNPFNGRTDVVDQQSPEQQAARNARQQNRSERLNRVEQNRIPDEQVPQGQRRITTPFGDRLVPAPAR